MGILLTCCKQTEDEEFVDIDQMAMNQENQMGLEITEHSQEMMVDDPVAFEAQFEGEPL